MCEPPFLHTAASFLCFPGVKWPFLHTASMFLGLPGVKWPFLHTADAFLCFPGVKWPFLHTAASFLCFPGAKWPFLHTADAFLCFLGVKWPFLHTTLAISARPEAGLSGESIAARGLEREGPTNEAIVGKNVVLGGLRPTEGIAAGRRKGNHPLLPWGRRGIVELLRSSEATTLPGETHHRPERKVKIGR